jgi:hypothetical protein
MNMLSNEKNLEMPWYLLSLMEKYQENSAISRVPQVRTM